MFRECEHFTINFNPSLPFVFSIVHVFLLWWWSKSSLSTPPQNHKPIILLGIPLKFYPFSSKNGKNRLFQITSCTGNVFSRSHVLLFASIFCYVSSSKNNNSRILEIQTSCGQNHSIPSYILRYEDYFGAHEQAQLRTNILRDTTPLMVEIPCLLQAICNWTTQFECKQTGILALTTLTHPLAPGTY